MGNRTSLAQLRKTNPKIVATNGNVKQNSSGRQVGLPANGKKKNLQEVMVQRKYNVAIDDTSEAFDAQSRARNNYEENIPFIKSTGVFLFNPKSEGMKQWDMVMIALLFWTAVVSPVEVAFLVTAVDALFALNRLIDLLFLCDLVKNFLTPFFDLETLCWVETREKIALHYFKQWFIVDVMSILPFDVLGLIFDSDAIQRLKVLRFLRLMRLLKLLRIFRATRIFQRWESNMSISYGKVTVLKFLSIVIFCAHWLACLWRLVVELENSEGNWMKTYFLEDKDGVAAGRAYLVALYWSVMTMSTVGYGDVTPTTDAELVASVLAMVIGASAYAYVIGALCGIVANLDEAELRFRQTMDNLNLYMEEMNLPPAMRCRLRQYFRYAKHTHKAKYFHNLLVLMSPDLRGQVALFCNKHWIEKIPWFNPSSKDEAYVLTVALAVALRAEAYGPRDCVVRASKKCTHLYIIQRGVVAKGHKILMAGDYFGEDMLLVRNRAVCTVRALTFLELHALSHDDLVKILNEHDLKETRQLVRNAAIRLDLHRTIVRISVLVIKARIFETRSFQLQQQGTFRMDKNVVVSPRSSKRRKSLMILENFAGQGGELMAGGSEEDQLKLARIVSRYVELDQTEAGHVKGSNPRRRMSAIMRAMGREHHSTRRNSIFFEGLEDDDASVFSAGTPGSGTTRSSGVRSGSATSAEVAAAAKAASTQFASGRIQKDGLSLDARMVQSGGIAGTFEAAPCRRSVSLEQDPAPFHRGRSEPRNLNHPNPTHPVPREITTHPLMGFSGKGSALESVPDSPMSAISSPNPKEGHMAALPLGIRPNGSFEATQAPVGSQAARFASMAQDQIESQIAAQLSRGGNGHPGGGVEKIEKIEEREEDAEGGEAEGGEAERRKEGEEGAAQAAGGVGVKGGQRSGELDGEEDTAEAVVASFLKGDSGSGGDEEGTSSLVLDEGVGDGTGVGDGVGDGDGDGDGVEVPEGGEAEQDVDVDVGGGMEMTSGPPDVKRSNSEGASGPETLTPVHDPEPEMLPSNHQQQQQQEQQQQQQNKPTPKGPQDTPQRKPAGEKETENGKGKANSKVKVKGDEPDQEVKKVKISGKVEFDIGGVGLLKGPPRDIVDFGGEGFGPGFSDGEHKQSAPTHSLSPDEPYRSPLSGGRPLPPISSPNGGAYIGLAQRATLIDPLGRGGVPSQPQPSSISLPRGNRSRRVSDESAASSGNSRELEHLLTAVKGLAKEMKGVQRTMKVVKAQVEELSGDREREREKIVDAARPQNGVAMSRDIDRLICYGIVPLMVLVALCVIMCITIVAR